MIRWTSTPLKLTVYGNTLAQASTVKVTIKQGVTTVTKTVTPTASGANAIIEVPLTVQETAQFVEGICQVQVVWKTGSVQSASLISTCDVIGILKEEAL